MINLVIWNLLLNQRLLCIFRLVLQILRIEVLSKRNVIGNQNLKTEYESHSLQVV